MRRDLGDRCQREAPLTHEVVRQNTTVGTRHGQLTVTATLALHGPQVLDTRNGLGAQAGRGHGTLGQLLAVLHNQTATWNVSTMVQRMWKCVNNIDMKMNRDDQQ